jgi:hypothetical protein
MAEYMAVDQHGNTFHALKHPRKDLMKEIGSKHADKMYVDLKSGGSKQIGYVIGKHWLSVYEVMPMGGKKKSGTFAKKRVAKKSCKRRK